MCLETTPHRHDLDVDAAPPPLEAEPEADLPPDHEPAKAFDRRGFLRRAVVAGAGAALAGTVPMAVAQAARPAGAGRFRDLTHVFRAGSPVYTFSSPTRQTLVTIPANGFYAQQWSFAEHSGTHLDAPGHFVTGNRLADELPPDELVAPIVVIDISARVASNPDAEVVPEDLRAFERRHGRIPKNAIVAMYSGWETRIGSSAAYRNADANGVFHFPGFSLAAAEWLLENRAIRAIGVDTLSLDNGPSSTFGVHLTVLGAERYGLENLRGLSTIPARGATAFVGLVPWEQGSGGPARVIATW
jgi:kynurenine formamidase